MGSQEPFNRLLKCRFVFHVCLISVFVIVVNPKIPAIVLQKHNFEIWNYFLDKISFFVILQSTTTHTPNRPTTEGPSTGTELPKARKTPGIVPRPIGRAFQEADGRGEGEGFKTKRQAPQVGRRDKHPKGSQMCANSQQAQGKPATYATISVALSTEPASRNRRVNQ